MGEGGCKRPGSRWPSRAALALGVACAALLADCKGSQSPRPPEKVRVAVAMLPHASLVHIAAANGYFTSEGLDATIQEYVFGKPALEAMLAGRADLATCAETPLVFAILQGQPASILATIATSRGSTSLLARAASGISEPAALAGKRIGVARGTTGEYFLDTFLLRHGVAREAVQIVEMKPEAMLEALTDGRVDAVAVWSPFNARILRQLGDKVREFTAPDIYLDAFMLATRPGFASEHPGLTEKFLRALVRAETFARSNPEAARRIVSDAIRLDRGQLDPAWTLFEFRVRLDQSAIVLMEEVARWAIRSGHVPRQELPNLLPFVDEKPLQAANPDSVTVMR